MNCLLQFLTLVPSQVTQMARAGNWRGVFNHFLQSEITSNPCINAMMVSPDKLTDQERNFARFLWNNSSSDFKPSSVLSIESVTIHRPHKPKNRAEPYHFNSVPDSVIISVLCPFCFSSFDTRSIFVNACSVQYFRYCVAAGDSIKPPFTCSRTMKNTFL